MSVPTIQLGLLSKYRTPLMGFAAIMIIAIHALNYGVIMPSFIYRIFGRGYLGVDLFLFLSGIGCFYSLSKNAIGKGMWYKKRFLRIFIPYALMQVPFWIYQMCVGTFQFGEQMLVFSTIGFWLKHIGAWYVALLIPLYLITPPICEYLLKGCRLVKAVLLIVLLHVACSIDISGTSGIIYDVLENIQWAFSRVPSFIMGIYMAPYVKNNICINGLSAIIVAVVLFGAYMVVHQFISSEISMHWCIILPLAVCMACLFDKLAKSGMLFKFISWLGIVSLESYLANIYLCWTVSDFVRRFSLEKDDVLHGHYLEYVTILLLGLLLSYVVNILSQKVRIE